MARLNSTDNIIRRADALVRSTGTRDPERIAEALRYGTASRTLMRRAGQYAVSVYRPVYRELLDAGKVEPVEGAEDFAILVDDACYDDEKGLLEQVPTGQADFF